jgi:hypothetical protein
MEYSRLIERHKKIKVIVWEIIPCSPCLRPRDQGDKKSLLLAKKSKTPFYHDRNEVRARASGSQASAAPKIGHFKIGWMKMDA